MVKGQLYYEVVKLLNPRRRRNNKSNHHLLKVVVYHELRDVIESLDKGICPFCGRRFQSYMVARSHVARSECSFALKSRIDDTLKFYRRVNKCIVRTGRGYLLRVGDLRTPFFKTRGELAVFIAGSGFLDKLKSSF